MSTAQDSIFEVLQSTGIPAAYSHFTTDQDPPFIVYLGGGQVQFKADNELYKKANIYQVEYYFKTKDEEAEAEIEQALTDASFFYEKSEDEYITDQDLHVIYYDVFRKGFYNGKE